MPAGPSTTTITLTEATRDLCIRQIRNAIEMLAGAPGVVVQFEAATATVTGASAVDAAADDSPAGDLVRSASEAAS